MRNGTIGWTLAGQELDKGQSRKFKEVSESTAAKAAERARSVADQAGVKRVKLPFEHGVLLIRQELNESVLPIFRLGNLKLIELLISLTLEPQKNM